MNRIYSGVVCALCGVALAVGLEHTCVKSGDVAHADYGTIPMNFVGATGATGVSGFASADSVPVFDSQGIVSGSHSQGTSNALTQSAPKDPVKPS